MEIGTQRPRPRGWYVGARQTICLPRWLNRKCERENVCGASEGETVRRVPENLTGSASPTEEGQDACLHITPGLSDNVSSQTNLWVKRRSIGIVHENNIDYKTLKLAECEKYTGWVGAQHKNKFKVRSHLLNTIVLAAARRVSSYPTYI